FGFTSATIFTSGAGFTSASAGPLESSDWAKTSLVQVPCLHFRELKRDARASNGDVFGAVSRAVVVSPPRRLRLGPWSSMAQPPTVVAIKAIATAHRFMVLHSCSRRASWDATSVAAGMHASPAIRPATTASAEGSEPIDPD